MDISVDGCGHTTLFPRGAVFYVANSDLRKELEQLTKYRNGEPSPSVLTATVSVFPNAQ